MFQPQARPIANKKSPEAVAGFTNQNGRSLGAYGSFVKKQQQ